jgi:DNA polymerase-3 subunit chi
MASTFSLSTQIDFHSNVGNHLDYACRLVRKALAAQCKIIVRLQDETQLTQFDQLLWEFSGTDFLPHIILKTDNIALAQQTPVILTLASDADALNLLSKAETGYNINSHNEIMLNLSDTVPTNFAQFERLIEIVPQEVDETKASTQAGRERYRFYQQQGYQLNHIIAK